MMREDQAAGESMLKKLGEAGIPLSSDRPNADSRATKVVEQEMQKLKQVDDRNRARIREYRRAARLARGPGIGWKRGRPCGVG